MDIEEVRKITKLARLDLSGPELADMAKQLSAILEYIDQLKQLDTDGVEPLAHPLPIQNVFRTDEPGQSLSVDDALRNAPNRMGDFFGVPAILESEESNH